MLPDAEPRLLFNGSRVRLQHVLYVELISEFLIFWFYRAFSYNTSHSVTVGVQTFKKTKLKRVHFAYQYYLNIFFDDEIICSFFL